MLGEPGQPDRVEQCLGPVVEPVEHAFGAPEVERIAERPLQRDPDILAHAQMREHGRNLERAHESPSRDIGRPRPGDLLPLVIDVPGGRFEELGEQIEYGRLAGAVRADQRMDRAAPHPQIDPLHRGETAELLCQTARLKDQIGQNRLLSLRCARGSATRGDAMPMIEAARYASRLALTSSRADMFFAQEER